MKQAPERIGGLLYFLDALLALASEHTKPAVFA